MDAKKSFPKELFKIIAKSVETGVYGSIEVYFEKGKVTQITQRIINKVHHPKKEESEKVASY